MRQLNDNKTFSFDVEIIGKTSSYQIKCNKHRPPGDQETSFPFATLAIYNTLRNNTTILNSFSITLSSTIPLELSAID